MNDLPSKKDLESTGDNYGFRMNGRLLGGGLLAIVLVVFILSNRQDGRSASSSWTSRCRCGSPRGDRSSSASPSAPSRCSSGGASAARPADAER